MNQIIAHTAHALVNVFRIVFTDATLSALVCVEILVLVDAKSLVCTLVLECVVMVMETAVSLHVREIVAVLVLDHRFNHVKTALVHVHLPAKEVVAHLVQLVVNLLVKMDAKKLVDPLVRGLVIQDVKMAANQDVKEVVVLVAKGLVIQDARKPVIMDAKDRAKAIALARVLEHVLILAKVLVIWDVSQLVVEPAQDRAFIVVVGGAQTISQCGRI